MKNQVRTLLSAKPVLPGKLEKHYNVCGKAGCRCKDKINPRKHGPYYRLSYSVKGKNSSVFVRETDAAIINELTNNYREARSNIQDLSLEMIQAYRQDGLEGMLEKYQRLLERETRIESGIKPESAVSRQTRLSRDTWKKKAVVRQKVLDKKRVEIRDLKKSREKWRSKCLEIEKENKCLQKRLSEAEDRLYGNGGTDNKKKHRIA